MSALCKAAAPGVTRGERRLNAHKQRCGALAEPGVEYCAAHAKAAGLLRCPDHGWVQPLYQYGTAALLTCPRRVEGGWCRHGWDTNRQLVERAPAVDVPIGQAGE